MAQGPKPMLSAVDHILLGVPNLDHGIAWIDKRLGVHAAVGGVHPGAGTRNALLSLGAGHYFEIIAPDPAQPAANDRRHLRQLSEPRVITFAVTTNDIDAIVAKARKARLEVTGPDDGSRRLPSGAMLRWQTLAIRNDLGAGVIQPVPFFIQWAVGSPHPSSDSPQGCVLESLEFEHPDPVRLNLVFEALGFDADVSSGSEVRIIAGLKAPKGRLKLS
jgi:glyoxalase-like protein